MRMKIEEIGPRDYYHLRADIIGKTGEWDPESMKDGWQSGYMRFNEPIHGDLTCLYFVQVRVAPTEPINRHGHPDFYRLCEEEMDLHSRKNWDYSAGGDPLGNFNRVSAILVMYPRLKLSDPAVVAITYMLKQLDSSLWMLSNGHEAKVEGQKERWQDISVYSKIISILISEGGGND
jgi:hypothetical protein